MRIIQVANTAIQTQDSVRYLFAMEASHNNDVRPVMNFFVSSKPKVNLCASLCKFRTDHGITVSRNNISPVILQSVGHNITERVMAKHCSFKCIHVLAE